MNMKVRYPTIDFSKTPVHWAKNIEYSQSFNAFSVVPTHIEPYLVKVMRKVKKALDPKHKKLHEDIDIFNGQEMQHCKQHIAHCKLLHDNGYGGMIEIENQYKADYENFLKNKSLRFNVAYCEGFEALGCAAGEVYFTELADFFEGGNEEVSFLWQWHLAEEFEHRAVCSDVYKTLYGKGPLAYIYRVWIYVYAMKHISYYKNKVQGYLLSVDREKMTKEEKAVSIKREKETDKRIEKAYAKILKSVFSPFYDPSKKVAPSGMAEVLAKVPDTRI